MPHLRAVETRLTAEQFYEEHYDQFLVVGVGSDRHKRVYRFAEAFRDKSEAGLRETVTRCLVMTREADALFKQEMRFRRTAEAEAAALRERERWVSVEEKLPKRGKINPFNTHPKNYWILHEGGRITWDCIWLNWDFKAMGVTHWAEAKVPEALSAAPERGKDGK